MLSHKDEGQNMGGGGGGGGQNTSSLRPPEQILKCPRCGSSNTKFCYYNNYSLAQPRHFCKACRRYWTKGGTFRNVPIGGSCRKNKKTTKSSSKCSSWDIERMKCFGLSTLDFHLGGLNCPPRVSYGDINRSTNHSMANLDPLGRYNLPVESSHIVMKHGNHHHEEQQHNQNGGELGSFQEMGTSNHHLASSIESLSSINQDLHWKLQQQRLAMLFGGGGSGSVGNRVLLQPPHQQKLQQPILFENLQTSKPAQSSMVGDQRNFFDNSYAQENLDPPISKNGNGAGDDQNGSLNKWNGIQVWNHLNEYSS